MAEKYQIFVSSTFEDLKVERDRVIKGILEMGHIPVGMEMFSAADEQQWKIISRHIDESDYYLVIIAHRYGSTVDGISFTRKEYEYAVSRNVPIIGFVIDLQTPWPPEFVDTETEAVEGLKAFKELVSAKPVGFWTNADDLYGKSSVALVKAFSAQPRTGWIRASAGVGPEVTVEISRLSAENASLRAQLLATSMETEREYEAALRRDLEVLEKAEEDVSVRYLHGNGWEDVGILSLARVFELVSPMLVVEDTVARMAGLIAVNVIADDEERTPLTIPVNVCGSYFSDLMAFGLVEPSARRHAVADSGSYWTLTKRGADLAAVMTRARLARTVGESLNKNPSNVAGPLAE